MCNGIEKMIIQERGQHFKIDRMDLLIDLRGIRITIIIIIGDNILLLDIKIMNKSNKNTQSPS